MALLVSIIGMLGDFLLKMWRGRPPTALVVEAEKAGAAQASLAHIQASNEQALKSAEAVDRVAVDISTPDGLRKYEAADPNNSDNDRS